MVKFFWKTFFACLVIMGILVFNSRLNFASSNEVIQIKDINTLINNSNMYDGKMIIMSGEAILEPLERKDGVWVNINDGSNAIGVFMKGSEAGNIRQYGNYHQYGDKISVKGIFHKSCSEHGGDLDIHLEEIKRISLGSKRQNDVSMSDISVMSISLIMFLAIGGYTVLNFKRTK